MVTAPRRGANIWIPVIGNDFEAEFRFISFLYSRWLFSAICCWNKVYSGINCGRPSIHLILNCRVPVHFNELISSCLFIFLSPWGRQSTVGPVEPQDTKVVCFNPIISLHTANMNNGGAKSNQTDLFVSGVTLWIDGLGMKVCVTFILNSWQLRFCSFSSSSCLLLQEPYFF